MERHRLLLAAVLVLAACQQGPAPLVSPSPAPLGTPVPAPALRPPSEAVLADAQVGRGRTGGKDHLSAAEAARDQPDQVLALQLFAGWGWVEMATRAWGSASDEVLLTLRAEGAARAYALWAGEAEQSPYSPAPCPAAISGLDQCRYGAASGSAIVVGRLDSAVFRMVAEPAAIERLAGIQAGRLRA